MINKAKNGVLWTYVMIDTNGEEIIGTFYEKELQKTSQTLLRIKKVIQRKDGSQYIKWKGYDHSFKTSVI